MPRQVVQGNFLERLCMANIDLCVNFFFNSMYLNVHNSIVDLCADSFSPCRILWCA
jgi:hypothetical protein